MTAVRFMSSQGAGLILSVTLEASLSWEVFSRTVAADDATSCAAALLSVGSSAETDWEPTLHVHTGEYESQFVFKNNTTSKNNVTKGAGN